MVSPISANIATAAAKALPNPQAQAVSVQRAPEAAQAAQAVQADIKRANAKMKVEDKKRGVDNSKKAEAAFKPQENKPKPKPAPGQEEEEKAPAVGGGDSLNVLA